MSLALSAMCEPLRLWRDRRVVRARAVGSEMWVLANSSATHQMLTARSASMITIGSQRERLKAATPAQRPGTARSLRRSQLAGLLPVTLLNIHDRTRTILKTLGARASKLDAAARQCQVDQQAARRNMNRDRAESVDQQATLDAAYMKHQA